MAHLKSTPLPSEALLRRLAPLAPVPTRPDLLAHQARDVFAVWTAWEEETGEKRDIPYWATVWPAAQMLARFIGANPEKFKSRKVLDLGCGCGIAGIAAAKAGAEVIANDIDSVALEMTRRNAAANGVTAALSEGDLLAGEPPAVDVILVCDLFYERSVSEKLSAWLARAHEGRPGRRAAEVLIADASRPFTPTQGVSTLAQERFPTDVDLEGSSDRLVRLLALSP
jgi:predicted nicotinamide N-methyase